MKPRGNFYAAANIYKSFVYIEHLAAAILELSSMDFKGTLHVGPTQKASYFTFYRNRLRELGYDENRIKPIKIDSIEHPYVSLDTSLNTRKAKSMLQVEFRNLHEYFNLIE